MKPHGSRFVVGIGVLLGGAIGGTVAAQEGSLEAFLADQRVAGGLPGLAAAVVDGAGFEWATGLGWAEIDRRPVTPDTPFLVASVSKPVTATALVAAASEGLIALDDDLRGAFSFPVAHPYFPDAPVTPRELLAHASSIVDDPARLAATLAPGDPTVSLRTSSPVTCGRATPEAGRIGRRRAPSPIRTWGTRSPATSWRCAVARLSGHS